MNWLVLDEFLDEPRRVALLAALRHADSAAAVVYGGRAAGVDRRVRSAQALDVDHALRDSVMTLLDAARARIAAHFDVALARAEEPQFLRYEPGDFFVAHQDGNTGLVRTESEQRRISAVIFLNEQSSEPAEGSYGGGELVLHGRYPDFDKRYPLPARPGSLVAFRSETTHEVTPVAHGYRYTIVSWYR
ncbi:MAG TPA: 2OG-Fe(II) oxygenase [Thermoanaerobaculia bacterium]|jgi:predicted 2-oxoglutarate/Fe(II)-dependent dioxygenase YbiX